MPSPAATPALASAGKLGRTTGMAAATVVITGTDGTVTVHQTAFRGAS